MAKFSERLKQLRVESGCSQQGLADKVSISKSSINMYERGEREPSFEKLERIADFFNVDVDYLLGNSDIPNKYALEEALKARSEFPQADFMSIIEAVKIPQLEFPAKKLIEAVKLPQLSTLANFAEIVKIQPKFHIEEIAKALKGECEYPIIELYNQLDEIDKAEIRGEMKQMLKAEKYKKDGNDK